MTEIQKTIDLLDHLYKKAEEAWESHYESFTYMGEIPYPFYYWLQTLSPQLFAQIDALEEFIVVYKNYQPVELKVTPE